MYKTKNSFDRLPFNWKTPIGYFFAFLLGSGSVFALAYSVLPTMCFAVGSYWLATAFIKDIKNDFHLRCDKVSTKHGKKMKEWKQHLCDVIKDISNVKQLSSFFFIFLNKINCIQCVCSLLF